MKALPPLDLLPYFSDSLQGLNMKTLYWPNDAHFNPEGYRIMAEKIAREFLQREGNR
jgi:lysophospholipase L1-like esterase